MKKTFYSNGKLLITGEYVVLDGAKALALPTKFGQYLHVEPGENQLIVWKSHDNDGTIWFEDTISFDTVKKKIYFSETANVQNTLIDILHEAYLQNPDFITLSNGYTITTKLTFPRLWGLGTSSTLINNIAQWLQIDAFELLTKSFGGSGYDIACAKTNTPIIYQSKNNKPYFESVLFDPDFKNNLYFVYLNRKQSSKTAITAYLNKRRNIDQTISKMDILTQEIIRTDDVKTFSQLLEHHECLMSDLLEMQTAKELLFNDFNGTVKSLGAWGGDFVMVVSKENPKPYFEERGYAVVISYKDMIR